MASIKIKKSRVTEYRTMLYLPRSLYLKSAMTARQRKKSLSALFRDAIESYIEHPPKKEIQKTIEAVFGIWKNRQDVLGGKLRKNLRVAEEQRARRIGY